MKRFFFCWLHVYAYAHSLRSKGMDIPRQAPLLFAALFPLWAFLKGTGERLEDLEADIREELSLFGR